LSINTAPFAASIDRKNPGDRLASCRPRRCNLAIESATAATHVAMTLALGTGARGKPVRV